MARTISEIQDEIKGYKGSRSELDVLSSQSKTAIWRAWIYIQSVVVYIIEVLFDTHRSGIEALIAEEKAHRPTWYRNKVLAFQYGMELVEDTDTYDNTGIGEDDIEAMKVVKYAAANDSGVNLIIKVAGETGGERTVLTAEQYAALVAYINEIKDAGVAVNVINQEADHYRATLDIYYDPMILDGTGQRLDGTDNTPVQTAIKDYLANLTFDGEYSNMALTDILQNVRGVVIPELKKAESYYGLYDWTTINAKVNPDSGYLKIYQDTDLTLNFIAYGQN